MSGKEVVLKRVCSKGGVLKSLIRLDRDTLGVLGQASMQGSKATGKQASTQASTQASMQACKQACTQASMQASMQASKQARNQALRRNSVGAMPCRGLFLKYKIILL